MIKLQPKEKIQVMTDGYNDLVVKNLDSRLCANYLNMSDIDGLKYPDIEWNIDARKYNYKIIAYTEYGLFKFNYDFNYNFSMNFAAFYVKLVEYLFNNVQD